MSIGDSVVGQSGVAGTSSLKRCLRNDPEYSPYSETDADWWIQKRIEHTKLLGKEATFAIRAAQDNLIGVVGADGLELGNTHSAHRAEIGYWLARPFWSQGIMTDVVRAYVEYAFGELPLLRLTAHVLEFNAGSARVLEKNGFQLEGSLRQHFRKDGQFLDARFYGLLKKDVLNQTLDGR
ncbi:MAG: GNAT family N-acetyltransferase [Acidobacteriota bacterium]|nr:GNAT family N-acetyltransferase [Acidobacteriota bacterium]